MEDDDSGCAAPPTDGQGNPPTGTGSWPLTAYSISRTTGFVPEPASQRRSWMDATPNRFAMRCLPLVMANQAGWVIRTPFGVQARWNGADPVGNIEVSVGDPAHPCRNYVSDHFGSGIVTFNIPFVFRTPPGLNLLVRGAPNFWVEGAHPLEGLVETDWATASFTMNWRIVTPNRWVSFAAGDPICFLQPFAVAAVEAAVPSIVKLEADSDLEADYRAWEASRSEFLADAERPATAWQKDYFVGTQVADHPAVTHRTRLRVASFGDDPAGDHPVRGDQPQHRS